MRSRKGFTMIELLVVLLIIGILAAVAAPMYFANTRRAKASEAVAVMSQIRQAEREYFVRHAPNYLNFDSPNLPNDPEASTTGLAIDVGTPQYFSVGAYDIVIGGASPRFTNPGPVDFVITATGSPAESGASNVECATGADTDCAIHATDVNGYSLEMDNSGRIYVNYGSGWAAW